MNFMMSYFVLQPQIFIKLFEILNCEEYKFDNFETKSFLRNYEGIECFTSYYNVWIFFIIIPSFLIYGIIAPFSSLVLFYLKKHKMNNRKAILEYDFLMRQPFIFKNSSIW